MTSAIIRGYRVTIRTSIDLANFSYYRTSCDIYAADSLMFLIPKYACSGLNSPILHFLPIRKRNNKKD